MGARRKSPAAKLHGDVVITEVTIKGYTLLPDGGTKALKHKLTHKGDGQVIDAIVLNAELLERLLIERKTKDGYDRVKPKPGKDWDHEHADILKAPVSYHCVWIHDTTCDWWSYCGNQGAASAARKSSKKR